MAGFPLRRFCLVAVIDSCLLTSEPFEDASYATGVTQIFEPGLNESTGGERASDVAELGRSMQLSTEVSTSGAMA